MVKIEEQIQCIPISLEEFNSRLMDRLHDRFWCAKKGLKYENPDISKARKELLGDLISQREVEKTYNIRAY